MSLDVVIFMLAVVYWVASSILGRRKKKARKEALKRQESSTPAPAAKSASGSETVSQIAKALGIYVPEEISPLPPPTYYEPVSEDKEKPKRRLQVTEKESLISKQSRQDKKKIKTIQDSVKQKTRRVKLSLSQVKKDLHLKPQLKKAVIFKTILDPPPSAHRRPFSH